MKIKDFSFLFNFIKILLLFVKIGEIKVKYVGR